MIFYNSKWDGSRSFNIDLISLKTKSPAASSVFGVLPKGRDEAGTMAEEKSNSRNGKMACEREVDGGAQI